MGHLQIHRQLGPRLTGRSTDDLRGELGQAEHRGELVEVGLPESVEGEDHDGDPLTGESGADQFVGVVGGHQCIGRQSSVWHVEREVVGARHVMREVAEDPADLRHLTLQVFGYRGLVRRGVEVLPHPPPVVPHRNGERPLHGLGRALDHHPVVTGSPLHRQRPVAGPLDQRRGS